MTFSNNFLLPFGNTHILRKKPSKNVSWQVNRERVSEIWIQRIRSKVSKSWTNNRTLAAWSSCWWHIEYFSVKMCILPIYIYKLQLIPSNIKVQKFLCNSIYTIVLKKTKKITSQNLKIDSIWCVILNQLFW